MSKIVVVVRNFAKIGDKFVVDSERKEYSNTYAVNNDRGELLIYYKQNNTSDPIAVFKKWIYWELIDEQNDEEESAEEYEPELGAEKAIIEER